MCVINVDVCIVRVYSCMHTYECTNRASGVLVAVKIYRKQLVQSRSTAQGVSVCARVYTCGACRSVCYVARVSVFVVLSSYSCMWQVRVAEDACTELLIHQRVQQRNNPEFPFLPCKHILKLHGVYEDEHFIYGVMEFCARGDMLACITPTQPFKVEVASYYLEQLCYALYCVRASVQCNVQER